MEALATMGAYCAQLQRILYLTVATAGGRLEMDESTVPPLWRLDRTRLADGKTLVLVASINEPPTEADINLLVDKLRGTNTRIIEIYEKMGLNRFPEDYLVHAIRNHLLWHEGRWMDASLVKGAEKPTGQN